MEHPVERAERAAHLRHLRHTVRFDSYVWLLTDPVTSVGASPLADVPSLPDLPRLIRLKYLTEVNRWTAPDQPVTTLRRTTGGDRALSLVWRELQSSYDVGDVASLTFRDDYGTWGFLDLWRSGDSARFTDTEVRALEREVRPVTGVLRRAAARTFATPDLGGSPAGAAVLLLSPDLVVRAQTAESAAILQALLPTEPGRSPVPAAAYNVGAQLLAREAGVDPSPATTRVHSPSGAWLTLRAARVGTDHPHHGSERPGADADSDIVVTIETATLAERADLFARAHGLSPRETELLGLLLGGADTHTVATRLLISEHTVQDHLKSVFAKTGVRNRRTLLAHVAGGPDTSSAPDNLT
ncbi:helix-turn-helix transcriptional regulator [Ornithinimicrobium cryptoxanthini]|uniref:LuxR C-terminal-related transcriptional regulator n=1 Tax=Ornithinimicrobium cryptoxanthini TaxID=2934161 RepID=A0ABY4YF63_9MICO|nr:LuxR C-terminal-related transcriptional regulator [Ornithinimicrobium cryptoxanthini]USQ75416.1 LuxR C-terminal-related transcriptional regulator [Ornithinimicrobium cryptoxanthini]